MNESHAVTSETACPQRASGQETVFLPSRSSPGGWKHSFLSLAGLFGLRNAVSCFPSGFLPVETPFLGGNRAIWG